MSNTTVYAFKSSNKILCGLTHLTGEKYAYTGMDRSFRMESAAGKYLKRLLRDYPAREDCSQYIEDLVEQAKGSRP